MSTVRPGNRKPNLKIAWMKVDCSMVERHYIRLCTSGLSDYSIRHVFDSYL